jgi:hypothetical protein
MKAINWVSAFGTSQQIKCSVLKVSTKYRFEGVGFVVLTAEIHLLGYNKCPLITNSALSQKTEFFNF